LLPNSAPINTRPYRYSPEQKTKIERQVAAMLQSGIIVPNLSLFASPVLLVKKGITLGDFVLIIESWIA
jgi:hypothetical protein